MIKHEFAIYIEKLLREYISEEFFLHSADGIEANPFMYIGLLIGYLSSNNENVMKESNSFLLDIYSKYQEKYFDKSSNRFEDAEKVINDIKKFIER